MKFFALFLASILFAASALAQSVFIGYPHHNASLQAGAPTIVQVDLPNFLSSIIEVAIVVAIMPCSSSTCPSPHDQLGTVLYNGPFNPQQPAVPAYPGQQAYDNFTVTIPSDTPTGRASLNVVHFALIGASELTYVEIKHIHVLITPASS